MIIDLGAVVRDELRPVVDELTKLRREIAELRSKREAQVLNSAALAERFNKPTVAAFNRWLNRTGGAAVLAIAKIDASGNRYWLAAELDALVTRGGL